MARRKKENDNEEQTPGMGHNLTEIKEKLVEARDKVLGINAQMEELQDAKNEIRSGVKALGISKKAFDFGLRRGLMDPEKRSELDEAYQIVCEAFGVPLGHQFTMFEEQQQAA